MKSWSACNSWMQSDWATFLSTVRRQRCPAARASASASPLRLGRNCAEFSTYSMGLHHRDNDRLLHALEELRDLGNTVLVVEHDEETINRADYVIDLGPGAGRHGGELVAHGTPQEIMNVPESLTGAYISGRAHIEMRA